jgi:hypothetical protein
MNHTTCSARNDVVLLEELSFCEFPDNQRDMYETSMAWHVVHNSNPELIIVIARVRYNAVECCGCC